MASQRTRPHPQPMHRRTGDEGFLLIGAIVMIALVLIALAIAAPIIARDLRRQKDLEAIHRGNQYVRAIQLYYRKFGRYPGSLEQLEKTNNIRFLRQRYTDPVTGKDDFAIIPVGQNKTTVKTFFGAPLAGLPTTGVGGGVGSVSNMLSPGIGIGANTGASATQTTGATSFGATGGTGGTTAAGAAATGTTATGASNSLSSTGTSNPAASGFGGSSSPFGSDSSGSSGGGLSQPFMGVTLGAKGDSIVELNEQTDYGTWEFLYDPRLDQLKARAAALNGGGPASASGSSLGQPSIPTGLTAPSPAGSTSPGSGGSTSPIAPTTTPAPQQ